MTTTGGSILSTASETELGLGTGVIVSSNGYILSNSHVTGEKYSTCYVTLEEKNTYKGVVVWANTDLDLSITKINAQDLPTISLGDSSNIRIGETVYAIGNPIGYEFRRTVTSGIISAINRSVKIEENDNTIYMTDLIQTDASINSGNSGGPLIDTKGKVIVVKPVIENFIQNESFEEANIGLYVYDSSVAQYINKTFTSGIYIEQIIKDGPAYGKGIKEGDIITKIDEKPINTVNELKQYIYTKKPGDTVKLKLTSGRAEKEISIILDKKY